MAKKKKEKIIYYDNGATLADMSAVNKKGERQPTNHVPPKKRSTFKEKWNTYWAAVKMMIMPMCVVLAIIGILYLLMMWMVGGA